MKNFKQMVALSLLVCTLMGFGMAVHAESETDMPAEVTIGDYTISSGEGAIVTEDPTETIAGKTAKIKIVHETDAETTVTVPVDILAAPAGGSYNQKVMGVYWPFFLATFEAEQGTDKGVKLTMKRTNAQTSFFQDASYTFWRKMMVYNSDACYDSDMIVTFSGKGTLYLGLPEVELTKAVINGGLEGVSGDGKIANIAETANASGWALESATLNYWKEGTEVPSEQGWYVAETAAGNYIMAVKMKRTIPVRYNVRSGADTKFASGATYKVTVSHKASKVSDGGCGFSTWSGLSNLPTSVSAHWAKGTTDWADKSYTSVYNFGTSTKYGFGLNLHSRLTTGIAYFDDLRIEPAVENCTLYDAENTAQNSLIRDTVMTVKYEKPVWDTAKDTYAELTDGSKSKTTIAVIGVLYSEDEGNTKIESLKVLQNTAGAILSTPDSYPDAEYALGYMPASPALEDFTFFIPKDGDYTLKIFAWNSIDGLTPAGEKAYVFTTTPDAA